MSSVMGLVTSCQSTQHLAQTSQIKSFCGVSGKIKDRGLLSCSQKSTIYSHFALHKTSAHPSSLFKFRFNIILSSTPRTSKRLLSLTNNPTRCTILFKYIYLRLFSTCFGHSSAHHQEKITASMRHWYLSLLMHDIW